MRVEGFPNLKTIDFTNWPKLKLVNNINFSTIQLESELSGLSLKNGVLGTAGGPTKSRKAFPRGAYSSSGSCKGCLHCNPGYRRAARFHIAAALSDQAAKATAPPLPNLKPSTQSDFQKMISIAIKNQILIDIKMHF